MCNEIRRNYCYWMSLYSFAHPLTFIGINESMPRGDCTCPKTLALYHFLNKPGYNSKLLVPLVQRRTKYKPSMRLTSQKPTLSFTDQTLLGNDNSSNIFFPFQASNTSGNYLMQACLDNHISLLYKHMRMQNCLFTCSTYWKTAQRNQMYVQNLPMWGRAVITHPKKTYPYIFYSGFLLLTISYPTHHQLNKIWQKNKQTKN